ncbi:hypothetical protein E5675_08225 [Sphingopyxis sp. PAMC25046]|uniref:hypothetical protein n=1 Tax=Sphingopyxis sp. PAMC25046 TaxID=2565556 RepID=UPI00109DDD8C|nr:hypothetical protein [Sphingopyxis sp. PAMC25046]QCB54425.1 hypothetical protein E5675_08225 [Sphingopyxis sp. PAMC25046]
MLSFTEDVALRLDQLCRREPIHWIGLGRHDFQFAFEGVSRIACFFKVSFFIDGKSYDWTEEPPSAPIWRLVGQTPQNVVLLDELRLRISFSSGDHIDIFSDHAPYEAVLIEFATDHDKIELEVF